MFTVTISTANAAFANDDGEVDLKGMKGMEVARILRHIADLVEGREEGVGFAVDVNGNQVGNWKFT